MEEYIKDKVLTGAEQIKLTKDVSAIIVGITDENRSKLVEIALELERRTCERCHLKNMKMYGRCLYCAKFICRNGGCAAIEESDKFGKVVCVDCIDKMP